ncbi:MAG: DUF1697 domain-containing protein [Anaerolineales bacterium]
MTRYIAFLRAINVGGHTVKMDRLRALFAELGLPDAQTFIASGNVIFDSAARNTAALEMKISGHLRAALGYEVAAFVRSAAELAAVARYQPFPPAGPDEPFHGLYVGFLAQPLALAAREALLAYRTPVDDFHTHQREIYWLCRIRSSDSTFSLARLEKSHRLQATFRSATTVRKLAAQYAGLDGEA